MLSHLGIAGCGFLHARRPNSSPLLRYSARHMIANNVDKPDVGIDKNGRNRAIFFYDGG